eukprot:Skav234828  [mRNA]  locus=scaffold69:1084018:1086710:- [translate_table: standard]
MAIPSVQGFAQWNLQRRPEVLEVPPVIEVEKRWIVGYPTVWFIGSAMDSSQPRREGPLRIFSMYTGWGTAEMVTIAVRRELQRLGISLEQPSDNETQGVFQGFEVAWICESNPEKCRDVPYIFTDASEVADGFAHDFRTGRKMVVPVDLDLGFVGYPCVDLSSLNVEPGRFMDTNTATGRGYANMLKLVDLCDNLLFLGVENSGNMWRKRKQAGI